MKQKIVMRVWTATLLTLAAPSGAHAQGTRRSQRATVSQTIGQTEITVVYSRPVARGRTLFGDLVPYDRVWHPGANEATTIEFSDAVLIGGQELPAGKYGIWTLPKENEPWVWIFSNANDVSHRPYPEGQDQLRVELKATPGSHMEVMAYYFPEVGPTSATLNFHWGKTVIQIPIELKP